MPLLPTSAPSGTQAVELDIRGGDFSVEEVTFGELIPGPEGPTGPYGPSILLMSVPNNPLIVSVGVQPFAASRSVTILSCKAACGAAFAPQGSDIVIDIKKNGTTIFTNPSNRPKILAGQTVGATVVPDVTAIAVGDVLTVDIVSVGSTTPGSYLTLTIEVI